MDFSQVAAEFQRLKAQFEAGALAEAEFKARLEELMLQDEQGRWWMIGYETGQWYVHDGERWVKAQPPAAASPALGARKSAVLIPKLWLWLWAGASIVGVVLLALLISRILPEVLPPTAVLPTATPVPPTITSATPTVTPRPPTATPVPPTITSLVSVKDGMTMVSVPAGEFLMGSADSDSEADSDEKPQHKVYLDAFWIDQTEVTKDQYQKCVDAGKCAAPGCSGTGKGDHPVVCVSWQDATNYCGWAGRRLPTEAEWEKAARGTDGRKYPWGNEAPNDKLLNYNRSVGNTSAVGSYPSGASPYGALDMAGNVWEWTADWYNETYYQSGSTQNPQGPASGSSRVLRSGSWLTTQWGVRAAARNKNDPGLRVDLVGFRCACGTSP
jgi:serine/threonine-protein kinase